MVGSKEESFMERSRWHWWKDTWATLSIQRLDNGIWRVSTPRHLHWLKGNPVAFTADIIENHHDVHDNWNFNGVHMLSTCCLRVALYVFKYSFEFYYSQNLWPRLRMHNDLYPTLLFRWDTWSPIFGRLCHWLCRVFLFPAIYRRVDKPIFSYSTSFLQTFHMQMIT